LVVLGGFSVARLLDVPVFERLEQVSYDMRVHSAERTNAPCATNLGCIFVDDSTITAVKRGVLGTRYGLHWPRHVYGRILEEASLEGAKVIAFDVLFGELREDQYGFSREGELIQFDQVFADQIRTGANVCLASEKGLMPPDLFRTNAVALGDISTDKDSDGVLRKVRAFRDYRLWHPAFRQVEMDPDFGIDLSKARVEDRGIVLVRAEEEDIIVPLDENGMFDLADFGGDRLPSGMPTKALPYTTERVWHMGVVLAAYELGLDLEHAQVDLKKGRIVLRGEDVERVIPTDTAGRFYIDWAIRVNDPRLKQEPALNLLRRSVALETGALDHPPRFWAGKLVVVGSTAIGNNLSDMGATPLDPNTFLISKHWNVANSIIMNQFIRRGSPAWELIPLLLAGACAGVFALWLRPVVAFSLTLSCLLAYGILAFVLYARERLWIPLVMPMGAALTLYLVITTWRVVFERSERRRVRSVFSKVVSPNVVSELLGAKALALGGARREITIFFADVRGFTALTDQAQAAVAEEVAKRGLTGDDAKALFDQHAAETLSTVNLYLARVADVIKKHNGTLDKYIGDCVMAFWGAPTSNSKHALHCVRAAIDAQRAIASVNALRREENARRHDPATHLPLLSLGSGINTGQATVGLMGSDAHILSYTVFGREVNIASRLEGVSGRDRIIISEATFAHLERDDPALAAQCVALESVSVKGIREQVRIYEVPWRDHPSEQKAGE
jgi:class 3 adenylate cyclase